MSDLWARWRIAFVPLGLAIAVIVASWTLTWLGPETGDGARASGASGAIRATSGATGPGFAMPGVRLGSNGAPPTGVAAPFPSATPPLGDEANAVPFGAAAAPRTAPPNGAAPKSPRAQLDDQRKEALALVAGYEAELARATSEAADLERTGRAAEASEKQAEARRLKRQIERARRTLTNLDEAAGEGR